MSFDPSSVYKAYDDYYNDDLTLKVKWIIGHSGNNTQQKSYFWSTERKSLRFESPLLHTKTPELASIFRIYNGDCQRPWIKTAQKIPICMQNFPQNAVFDVNFELTAKIQHTDTVLCVKLKANLRKAVTKRWFTCNDTQFNLIYLFHRIFFLICKIA